MSLHVGTLDGLWHVDGSAERMDLGGKNVVHVADRDGLVVAAVPHDGVYSESRSGSQRIWEGDARSVAIGVDGTVYVGTEPAMVFRGDAHGTSWTRCDAIDTLPTRSQWYFPADVHEPHVRSIELIGESDVLVGVEVGGVLRSKDGGVTWREMNEGVYVDVHTVRADPAAPERMIAATGRGVYLSEDGAETWQHIQVGDGERYAVGVHVNPERAGEILIATGDRPPGLHARVFHSLDGGHSWVRVADPALPAEYERVPVVLFGDGSAWLLTDTGQVFRADDPRGRWSHVADLGAPIHAASAGGSPCSVNYGYA